MVWVYLYSNLRGGLRKRTYFETEREMALQGHARYRKCKVIDFGTNRKGVCDFRLVINGNLGHILSSFRGIAGFLLRSSDSTLFHPNFRVFPLGLDCRCCGSEQRTPYKLIIREIILSNKSNLYAHCTSSLQTERRTDRRTTYDSNIALCITCMHRAIKSRRLHFIKDTPCVCLMH